MRRSLRNRVLQFFAARLTATGQLIARSHLVQWAARLRAVHFVARILVVVWTFLTHFIWLPSRRLYRRTRKFLGRREVFPWLITWGVCALLGWVLLLPTVFLKLLGGSVVAVAFTLITFRSPLHGVLIWLLLSPLLNALIRFKFMEGMPVITGDRVCLIILMTAYLVHINRENKAEPSKLLHAVMIVFVASMLLAVLPAERPKWAAQEVLDSYMAPIMAYFLARRWINNRKALATTFAVVMCVSVYFTALAVPEHLTGRNYFTFTGQSAYVEEALGTVRVQGPAESPQEFGLILTAGLLLAMTGFSWEKESKKRFLLFIVMAAAVVGIGLTLRRSVYLGAVIGLLFLLASSKQTRRVVLVALVLGSVVGLAKWEGFSSSKLYSERIGDVRPLYSRAITQATAINIIKHNPIFGVGISNYSKAKFHYMSAYKDIGTHYGSVLNSPHNSYLRIMLEGGMVAFVPFILMIILILHTSFRAGKRASGPGLTGRDGIVMFWGLSAAILAQAASTDSFHYSRYLVTTWLFLFGAIVGVHLQRRALDPDSIQEPAEAPAPKTSGRALRKRISQRAI